MKLLFDIYKSAVAITSPLETITDPLKEIKMVKTQKRFQTKKFILLIHLGTLIKLFMTIKMSPFAIIAIPQYQIFYTIMGTG